jgi:hypothetical protein
MWKYTHRYYRHIALAAPKATASERARAGFIMFAVTWCVAVTRYFGGFRTYVEILERAQSARAR